MKVEMGNSVLQLPVEITTDIFSRLPVDSVIGCKLVCKTWRSLVEDPVFPDIHTHHLLSKPDAAASVTNNTEFYLTVEQLQENRQKHLQTVEQLQENRQKHLQTVKQLQENRLQTVEQLQENRQKHHFGECNNHETSNSSNSFFKLSKPLNNPFSKQYYWKPIGSSNGLICSYGVDEKTIYVYNPCTRESVRLPRPIFISKQLGFVLRRGFGYNYLTNEYKVVLIRGYIDEEGMISLPEAEVCVYTLGSGKWRIKKLLESTGGLFFNGALHWIEWELLFMDEQTQHDIFSFTGGGLFFNGALHWIAWELINMDQHDIFSFDLANEEFRIIAPSPPLPSRLFSNSFYIELGLWGGCCLCVMEWNTFTGTTDIWMLMNSKDKEMKSWTMKFKIPAAKNTYHHPIALLGRDKILLCCLKRDGLVFVSYNSETRNFEDEEVIDYSELQPSKSNSSICSVTPYTKSIVSLKAFKEEDAGLAF